MTTLALYGKLEAAPLFRTEDFSTEKLATVFASEIEEPFLDELKLRANELERNDIAHAIEESISRSRRARYLLKIADKLGVRFFWRFGEKIKKHALAGMISR